MKLQSGRNTSGKEEDKEERSDISKIIYEVKNEQMGNLGPYFEKKQSRKGYPRYSMFHVRGKRK